MIIIGSGNQEARLVEMAGIAAASRPDIGDHAFKGACRYAIREALRGSLLASWAELEGRGGESKKAFFEAVLVAARPRLFGLGLDDEEVGELASGRGVGSILACD